MTYTTTYDPDRFASIVDFPRFLLPWIDRFYEPDEIHLIVKLGSRALNTAAADGPDDKANMISEEFLNRAYKRGVLNRRQDGRFEPADFHARYDIWALFEGWQDIPDDIRQRLNAWELNHYYKSHEEDIAALKTSLRDPRRICPEYLLLHEAKALLDKVDRVYLWPCNCRAMIQGCRKPAVTCLRFSNNRGLGWEISKSRAGTILEEADRAGLMHSAEIGLASDGTIDGAICNCCVDCCFPHQLAEHSDARRIWPLSRHIARRLKERCTTCGRCVKRCPFDAFQLSRAQQPAAGAKTPPGENPKQLLYDQERCRGCGLCATGCPERAIVMDPLNVALSLFGKIDDPTDEISDVART